MRPSFARASSTSRLPDAVSAAKPTSTWPGRRREPSSARMSTVGTISKLGGPDDFLILWPAAAARPVVGDGSGHHDCTGTGGCGKDRPSHLFGVSTSQPRPQRRRQVAGGHEHHVGTTCDELLGDRVALFARATVADVPHRVDRLAGPAALTTTLTPARLPCRRPAPAVGEQVGQGSDDLVGLREPPLADSRRPPSALRPARARSPPAGEGARRCPAPLGAPTSRCASTGRQAPGPG